MHTTRRKGSYATLERFIIVCGPWLRLGLRPRGWPSEAFADAAFHAQVQPPTGDHLEPNLLLCKVWLTASGPMIGSNWSFATGVAPQLLKCVPEAAALPSCARMPLPLAAQEWCTSRNKHTPPGSRAQRHIDWVFLLHVVICVISHLCKARCARCAWWFTLPAAPHRHTHAPCT